MASHGYLLPTREVTFRSDSPDELAARIRADVLGLAERAEAAGFGSVWVGDRVVDHHRPEALTTLAAVASLTDSVALGTAVYLPNLRHPVHLAHRTATLDQLSGGRLVFGVGVGGPDVATEHERLNVPFEDRGTRLDETLDVLRSLWTGDRVDYRGEVLDVADAGIGFGPVRTPPILVATSSYHPEKGFPRPVADRIAAHGDGWLPISLSAEEYADGLDRIRDRLRSADRDGDRFEPALYQDVVVADSKRAAIDRAREYLRSYHGSRPDGLTDEQIERGGAFGPPEAVADHLERFEEAGVETFVTRFPATNQREQLSTYAGIAGL